MSNPTGFGTNRISSFMDVVAVIDTGINASGLGDHVLLPGINFSREGAIDDVTDGAGHGTAIAKAILAIAPNARILPIKLMDRRGLMRRMKILEDVFAWIVEHQQEFNISVVCAALADTSHQQTDEAYRESSLQQAIASLLARGVPTVAAAGNWYPEHCHINPQGMAYPAILREVVSVGAVQQQAEVWQFGRTSQRLHSSLATGCSTTLLVEPQEPDETSGAAARATGCLLRLKVAYPDATVDELIQQMNRFSQPMVEKSGLVWSVIDIDQVVRSLS